MLQGVLMKADVEGEIRVKCYMPSCSGEFQLKRGQHSRMQVAMKLSVLNHPQKHWDTELTEETRNVQSEIVRLFTTKCTTFTLCHLVWVSEFYELYALRHICEFFTFISVWNLTCCLCLTEMRIGLNEEFSIGKSQLRGKTHTRAHRHTHSQSQI